MGKRRREGKKDFGINAGVKEGKWIKVGLKPHHHPEHRIHKLLFHS